MTGPEHDLRPRVQTPRDVPHRDQLADVQGAHQAVGAPLGGAHRTDHAVDVDRDPEGGHACGRSTVAGDHLHSDGNRGRDEQDEQHRAQAGHEPANPAKLAGPCRRAQPGLELRDGDERVRIRHGQPRRGVVRLGARRRRRHRGFGRCRGLGDDGLGVLDDGAGFG